MEQHGKNPQQDVIAVIPARFGSTRLEGKLLLEVGGRPLILHTLERTARAANVSRVLAATDDERIFETVRRAGLEAVMTSDRHQSGSDRVAEVAASLPEGTIVVNVQGDEPLIPPETIERAVDAVRLDPSVAAATTAEPITDPADVLDPDVVKVVCDGLGFALYFSRAPVPYPREEARKWGGLEKALRSEERLLERYRKHTGLYVYRREFLLGYTRLKRTRLERTEMLEQLRILESGERIRVVDVREGSIGVDTAADLEKVRRVFGEAKERFGLTGG